MTHVATTGSGTDCQSFEIEVHYDNPGRAAGRVDNSGIGTGPLSRSPRGTLVCPKELRSQWRVYVRFQSGWV